MYQTTKNVLKQRQTVWKAEILREIDRVKISRPLSQPLIDLTETNGQITLKEKDYHNLIDQLDQCKKQIAELEGKIRMLEDQQKGPHHLKYVVADDLLTLRLDDNLQ
jgi:DNA-binding transcriptional regulator GbsR (MarR family)